MTTITNVEIIDDDNQLSEAEMIILNERREEYRKNPENTRSWEEIQAELKQQYSL